MLSRRTILALFLLLPIAAQANGNASTSKKRHHRPAQVEAISAETTTRPAKKAKARASSRSRTARKMAATKVEKNGAASHRRATAAASLAAEAEPTVITQGSTAASRLSPRAVDIIPANEASLYDRRTAQTPSSGVIKWFGPKADGVRYDSRMLHAAQIAESRARSHSIRSCWRYVKQALLAANVVNTYPGTVLAKQAGDELTNRHGFRRLSITDPFKAPVGSVLVYGGRGAGHVEIRTADGFVSDFESPTPSRRPLLGIFVKPT